MAIAIRGSANMVQSSSNTTPAFGVGWQTGDLHLIWQRCKNLSDSVDDTPTGYDDIDTEASTGTHLRISARILQGGDTAPLITPGGVALFIGSITLSGARNDSVANAVETFGHTSNASSSAINYPAATITTDGCIVLVFGTYNTIGAGTLGTPTTLSGSASAAIGPVTGSNMKGVLWTDLQTNAASITAGNIPITGGSVQTNRGQIIVIRPALPASVAGRAMMLGVG